MRVCLCVYMYVGRSNAPLRGEAPEMYVMFGESSSRFSGFVRCSSCVFWVSAGFVAFSGFVRRLWFAFRFCPVFFVRFPALSGVCREFSRFGRCLARVFRVCSAEFVVGFPGLSGVCGRASGFVRRAVYGVRRCPSKTCRLKQSWPHSMGCDAACTSYRN